MKNKKTVKGLTLALCALILIATPVMAFVAYLYAESKQVKNTFTVGSSASGKLEIDLDEAQVDKSGVPTDPPSRVLENSYELVYGHTYTKDPTVHLRKGSTECYLYVQVKNELKDIIAQPTLEEQILQNGWEALENAQNVQPGCDIYWRKVDAKTAGEGSDFAVFNNFTVKNDDGTIVLQDYVDKQITINAYAIQQESFANAAEAWNGVYGDKESEKHDYYHPTDGKAWPHVRGTFVQPCEPFVNYTEEQWQKHCDYLLEAGIDTVIIQCTSETPYGKISKVYYPTAVAAEKRAEDFTEYPEMVERILKACEERGMKVYMGLNYSAEWWSIITSNPQWNKDQAEIGIATAKELYDLYKEKYPTVFYGWYFAWEYYNGMEYCGTDCTDLSIAFLNDFLDGLNGINPSMPMMLSPFVRNVVTPEQTQKEWETIFKNAHFREGDIFCCQDSVGAGHIKLEESESYMKALRNACNSKKGLKFWGNIENFTQDFQAAPLERFVKQMEIAKPYVEEYVTFAYSHYYCPDLRPNGQHNAYVEYYKTGKIPKA